MPIEYIVASSRAATLMEMIDVDAIEERLLQLIHLEEELFIARFHQNVEMKMIQIYAGMQKNTQKTIETNMQWK